MAVNATTGLWNEPKRTTEGERPPVLILWNERLNNAPVPTTHGSRLHSSKNSLPRLFQPQENPVARSNPASPAVALAGKLPIDVHKRKRDLLAQRIALPTILIPRRPAPMDRTA